jgi:hypothetical protein
MGYGDKLVATNSVVQTVHALATTNDRGYVTTHARTACGLTGYRTANARQLATAARCLRCTSARYSPDAVAWVACFGRSDLNRWAALLSPARVKAMPRRERSWVRALAEGGFVPEADTADMAAFQLRCMTEWTGTWTKGTKGQRVSATARVVRVREFGDSVRGKNGKARPMQREITVEGTGADAGLTWSTTTRSAAAGRLAVGREVKVTGTVYCTSYRGHGEGTTLGQIVTNAAFA